MISPASTSLFKNPSLLRLYLLLIPGSLIVSAAMGYDSSLMNGIQGVDRWQNYFNHPQGSLLGIMNAILPLGAVFGTIPAAWLSDHHGRRWAMAVGDVIVILSTVIQTARINTPMYMASRFLIGLGITIASSSAPMLAAELAHPESRTTLTSMYNTLWYLGATWTTYGTYRINSEWSWRLPTALQALPAIINLVGLWFLPESPRWLVGQDRHDEARAILIKYHANGDQDSAFVAAEFEEIRTALQLELAVSRSWKELVETKANRHRTFLVICCAFFPQWSGNGLVIWNMVVAMTGANLVNRVGRRPLFVVATSCMLAGMIAWTITGSVFARTKSEATGAGILTCVIFFASSYNICWNPLAVAYPVEILPFNIRAKGIALLMGSIKGASFFNQFVNPIGLKNLGWKYYIVYCVWLCIVLITVFFMFLETKNRSLEEISQVFEKYSESPSEKKLETTDIECIEHQRKEKE
ncbi:hexose transporter [Fusarium acutatum]|uniref:Hexose transporter n=1 Tax=Fusarium acutatum TaxID=78861 RepID=A0A8H4NEX7_9HYPO|nr:hexose transporter [Fusarium acutatum]